MAAADTTPLIRFLHTLVPPEEVRRQAHRVGFIRRRRKVDAAVFVTVVVFALCGRGGQSFAALRRELALRCGLNLARSSFWKRFTVGFERLLEVVLERIMDRSRSEQPEFSGALAGFKDVVAVDATVVKVHKKLRSVWRGTRTTSSPAALKVHTWIRATTGELLRYRITEEARSDASVFGVNWSAAGKLLLFDRGYRSASLWWRTHRVGGYFVTRLSRSYKTHIVAENRRHRGRARQLMGSRFWSVLDGLKRQVIDVQGRFRIHVRGYGGQRGRYEQQAFRVVGLWNPKLKQYCVFVTNLPADTYPAELIADLYRMRWEVELFYKTAKGGLGLHELPTCKRHAVGALVRAALIRATVAMQARTRAERALPAGRWLNPVQWTVVWRQVLGVLADVELGQTLRWGMPTWATLARLAVDPNVKRPPTRWRLLQEAS